MSIAVEPTYQGQGIGKELVRAFLEEAKMRGLKYVNLTTDAVDNERVNHFYQKLGFQVHRSCVTPEGRKMNEYIFRLADLK